MTSRAADERPAGWTGSSLAGTRHRVRAEHRQVRVVSRGDPAPPRPSSNAAHAASDVKSASASGTRQALSGPPSARRMSVEVLPRDRGVEPEQRIFRLDREIAAAGESRALRRGSARRTRRRFARHRRALGPRHVGRRVRRLDRRDHAVPPEPRNVRGATTCACSMRGPIASRAARAGRSRRPPRTRRARAGCRDRRSRGSRAASPLPRAVARAIASAVREASRAARGSGLVGVVGEQRGAPAAERAVRVRLDGPHGQEVAPLPIRTPRANGAVETILSAETVA